MWTVFVRCSLFSCLALLMAVAAAPCHSQQVDSMSQQVDSMYGPLPVFEFHSGFWVNLHHFLYHEARARLAALDNRQSASGKSTTPGGRPSNIKLSPAEQKSWDDAISFYMANYAGKDLLINIDLILLKNQLEDFEDCDEVTGRKQSRCDAGLPGKIGPLLDSVAPIYRAHWWPDQDRSNRRWVIKVAPLVRDQGVGLSERLADIYQTHWPKDKIRVDVCAYADSAGAYTTLDPLRVTIASADPRNQGSEALEVLFHEASHGIAAPVEAAISRECKQHDKPIPRNLWHALIIYTTVQVLQLDDKDSTQDSENVSASLQPPKSTAVPYALQDILSQRGWDQYHLLLELYWQPYLNGRVTFDDAIAHLISAA
jgi:hypothetical protein